MVATQRRRMAQQEVADEHRHGAAHVRVGGHQGLARTLGLIGERGDERPDAGLQRRDATPHVEPEVERHLLVARAPGVQAAAVVADQRHQLALDEAVHVFVVAGDPRRILAAALEHRLQAVLDARDRGGLEHAGPAERVGPGEAADDVVLEELAVERERDAEIERRGIGRFVESTRPQMSTHASTSIRPSTTRSCTSPVAGSSTRSTKPSSPARTGLNHRPSRTTAA